MAYSAIQDDSRSFFAGIGSCHVRDSVTVMDYFLVGVPLIANYPNGLYILIRVAVYKFIPAIRAKLGA